jgi:hypothetical protein
VNRNGQEANSVDKSLSGITVSLKPFFALLSKYLGEKDLLTVSEIEIQQMVNAAATTIFSRSPSITYVNYQNFSKSYTPPTIIPYNTSSEILYTSFYSKFQET